MVDEEGKKKKYADNLEAVRLFHWWLLLQCLMLEGLAPGMKELFQVLAQWWLRENTQLKITLSNIQHIEQETIWFVVQWEI